MRLKIFGVKEVLAGFGQKDLQLWHKVAIKAKNRKELLECRVAFRGSPTNRYGLDLSVIRDTLNKGRMLLNEQFDRVVKEVCPEYESRRARSEKTRLTKGQLTALDCAVNAEKVKMARVERIVEFAGLSRTITLTPEIVSKVASSLDVAFTHTWFYRRQALTSTYNYRRDTGLVVDSQLLFYLADPSYALVTNDGNLRNAVAASSQSARVLSFAEFCPQAIKGDTRC